MSNLFLKCIDI